MGGVSRFIYNHDCILSAVVVKASLVLFPFSRIDIYYPVIVQSYHNPIDGVVIFPYERIFLNLLHVETN